MNPLDTSLNKQNLMNYELPFIPARPVKPRNFGLTMMMDKGLSLRQAENFIEVNADYCDIIKLGFGTSLLTKNLKEKIKLYQSAGLGVYLGGTLFEAFLVRGLFDEYKSFISDLGLHHVEISDGSIFIDHEEKCKLIADLAKDFTVLSEVGSKEAGILISPGKWIRMMKAELQAGSWKVIAEARESGNVGIYRPNGTAHTALINKILKEVKNENILWEAPNKNQQVWFINELGPNVNLGNISWTDVIPLETLRLGLRGDTFFNFLPEDIKERLKHKIVK
ncbi:MAG: phosphosulfolactate synthase [Luteibaculaceae bacterium]